MDNIVNMFQQRDLMDNCELSAKLAVDASNQIIGVSVTNQNACQMSLSGGAALTGTNVRMETYGPETTAWIDLAAMSAQNYMFTTPIPM
jgi:hypothetical protein